MNIDTLDLFQKMQGKFLVCDFRNIGDISLFYFMLVILHVYLRIANIELALQLQWIYIHKGC